MQRVHKTLCRRTTLPSETMSWYGPTRSHPAACQTLLDGCGRWLTAYYFVICHDTLVNLFLRPVSFRRVCQLGDCVIRARHVLVAALLFALPSSYLCPSLSALFCASVAILTCSPLDVFPSWCFLYSSNSFVCVPECPTHERIIVWVRVCPWVSVCLTVRPWSV